MNKDFDEENVEDIENIKDNEIDCADNKDKYWIGVLCAFIFNLLGVAIGFTYLGKMRESFFYGFRKGLAVFYIVGLCITFVYLIIMYSLPKTA